jgi:hypothetical protein
MELFRKLSAILSPLLIAVLVYTAIPVAPVVAGIVTTDELIDAQTASDSRGKVTAFLAREDVRRHLESMGVDPAKIGDRVGALSDREVSYLAQEIDQMPAGQGAIGLIILVAVVIAVVLLITDIVGVTNVYSFINKPAQR